MGIIRRIVRFVRSIVRGVEDVRQETSYYTDSNSVDSVQNNPIPNIDNSQNDYGYSNRSYDVGGKTREQFVDFVKSSFGAEYQIIENVATTRIHPDYVDARDLDLVFVKDGRPVLAILFTAHNKEKRMDFENARRVCANSGIKFLNFFEQMPNLDEYIVSRIRESL
jgi:hypothetical protein